MVAIFVALMFVSFVLIDAIKQRMEARQAVAASRQISPDSMAHLQGRPFIEGVRWEVPPGVQLSEGHAWVKSTQTGDVQIGADALLAYALGTPEIVSLPRLGFKARAGEPLFLLQSGKRFLTVPSPVSGMIVAVNEQLRGHPESLAGEPYDAGWVCAIAPSVAGEPSRILRAGERAAHWLWSEFQRFWDFMDTRISLQPDFELGAISQDGGLPIPGVLTQLGNEVWNEFEDEFLHSR